MLEGVRSWLVKGLLGAKTFEQLAALGETKVTDKGPWQALIREFETEDRLYVEWAEDVKDALEAWRKNFLIRQIVRLTTNYVVGAGIGLRSEVPTVEKFLRQWWAHPMNRMDLRLPAMCDELTRSGELFPVLFTNQANGMSYVRFIPARQISEVDTDPDDLERELRYHRLGTVKDIEGKWWKSPETAEPGKPVALHYAVNRPIGAVRGESDLLPILPWARRYTEWLKDRVRLNSARTNSGLWDVTIDDDGDVDKKKKQYKDLVPGHGSVIVHGKGEGWKPLSLNIEGSDASPDGKAVRLAVASGAGIPLHFLGEGESATKATAAEMGGPTFRHYTQRQDYFCFILKDIFSEAYRLSGHRQFSDLRLKTMVPDIEERDNKLMAESAKTIVEALATMRDRGWVTDELAIGLAFKFAGEILEQGEILRILEEAKEGRDGPGNGDDEQRDE
jgi:hypothetical protein